MDDSTEKDIIRARARELGFALCGFTTADPPAEFSRYRDWIAAGRHAQMDYLAAPRSLEGRSDPQRVLPGARAIVALAAPYPPPPDGGSPLEGRVAAYAVGDDYHTALLPKLRLLCAEVDRLAGRPLEHRAYTDTGPVLERELASRAGLGWVGRNSMLIHPALGSFFFLAEILTAYPFSPDPPFAADRCGRCDRCLRACPTGCILSDRTIDAGRCLAYLTIEHRGPIPDSLRGKLGNRIFGCDACQSVCPWNRKPAPAVDECFRPRAHWPVADLTRELHLEEAGWEIRFRNSALRRTGRAGYRRNLVLALGNSGRPEAVPVLRPALAEEDPNIRESAAWALTRLGFPTENL